MKLHTCTTILGNVLNDILWDDVATYQSMSPYILQLLEFTELHNTLSQFVRAIAFEQLPDNAGTILHILSSLEILDLDHVKNISDFSFVIKDHERLEALYVSGSSIKTCDGIDKFPSLTTLEAQDTECLTHIPGHITLTGLYLARSKIKYLTLEFPNLEELDVSETPELLTLKIPQLCPKLTSIKVDNSALQTIDSLSNCSGLKAFSLNPYLYTKLNSIIFNSQLMIHLTILDINAAKDLTSLSGLNCPNLIILRLSVR